MLCETLDTAPNRILTVAPSTDGHGEPPWHRAVRQPSGPRWYCVQAHPQAEGEAAKRIRDQGFEAFLPAVLEHRRKGPVYACMFPGYLFARFDRDAQQWRPIVSTIGVKRLFSSSPEHPTPLQHGVVEAILANCDEDGVLRTDPLPDIIREGVTVRLIGGPFMDQTGVCLWAKGDRVKLALTMFGRVLQPVVSRSQVEPA
jgi:transcriptional antiterminator RfaH